MELHKGKMSFKDLALWCGKSPRYFSNTSADLKEKFFEIFSFYADYHFEDKKLIIDEYFELHFFENGNGKYKLISIKN